MEDDAEKFLLAVRGGILGYILKDASARELASAIRMVANDEAVCPPGLCRGLFDFVARQATGQSSECSRDATLASQSARTTTRSIYSPKV